MNKKKFEQARKESIKKWTNVLYNDVYFSCGFCILAKKDCLECAIQDLEYLPHEVLAMSVLDWLLWDCTWNLLKEKSE
jgi:hypothetical protein